MIDDNHQDLREMALRVREHIVRMAATGGCFIGASLSCADILVYLYRKVLNISPALLNDPERDYLLLSKGHDVPALYGVLVECGILARERLANHLRANDHIYWHPHAAIPGIEFHSGSLGHLLGVGIGIASDIQRRATGNRVFVVLGDGELNEGSVWEAALTAHAFRLGNLIAIVDRNHFQANIETERLIPLEPLAAKFTAFGWNVHKADGHSFTSLAQAFGSIDTGTGTPHVIIADTIRGKGVPSIEQRADRWFMHPTAIEAEMMLGELHGGAITHLDSEPLHVR
jgi:transketolase